MNAIFRPRHGGELLFFVVGGVAFAVLVLALLHGMPGRFKHRLTVALTFLAGSFYVTSHARIPAAASAPSARRAPGALPAPVRLVRFACVFRSGTAAGPHPRLVPPWQARPVALCPATPAACHVRPGHPWPGEDSGAVLRVAVRPGQCIIAYHGKRRRTGARPPR